MRRILSLRDKFLMGKNGSYLRACRSGSLMDRIYMTRI
jgi:hypothetical protein